jgi:glycosyltransferase involved in cell wall biosynthesis
MKKARTAVSVVIPALNEGRNLVDTVQCVLENSDWPALEVIVVDDGSADGSPEAVAALVPQGRVQVVREQGLGVARARNRGAQAASGEVIVFLDGHCYVPPGWLAPLVEALSSEKAALAGPAFTNILDTRMQACGITWGDASLDNVWLPCPAQVAPVPFHIGACQAVRANVFHAIGGYDCGMGRWGSEDIELCLRLWLLGYAVYAQPASLVYHLFRTSRPYDVEVSQVLHNKLRLILLHFEGDRLARVLAPLLTVTGIAQSLAQSFDSDLYRCRQTLFARRKYDMDWFCQRFEINL